MDLRHVLVGLTLLAAAGCGGSNATGFDNTLPSGVLSGSYTAQGLSQPIKFDLARSGDTLQGNVLIQQNGNFFAGTITGLQTGQQITLQATLWNSAGTESLTGSFSGSNFKGTMTGVGGAPSGTFNVSTQPELQPSFSGAFTLTCTPTSGTPTTCVVTFAGTGSSISAAPTSGLFPGGDQVGSVGAATVYLVGKTAVFEFTSGGNTYAFSIDGSNQGSFYALRNGTAIEGTVSVSQG